MIERDVSSVLRCYSGQNHHVPGPIVSDGIADVRLCDMDQVPNCKGRSAPDSHYIAACRRSAGNWLRIFRGTIGPIGTSEVESSSSVIDLQDGAARAVSPDGNIA